ncbi:MAG: hypothetical protein EOP84_01245 [Verrucomicrobiaceae bacterium]|nr:MAG: hypothetical protein EOP84_01245 [Verrucomicrobiaceae bacterium]
MNRLCSLFPLVVLLLLLLFGGLSPIAEAQDNPSNVTFQLPIARAGHVFTLRQYDWATGGIAAKPMQSLGLFNATLDSNGETVFTENSFSAATGSVSLWYDYYLYDEFTGESTPLNVYYGDTFNRHSFLTTPWFNGELTSSYFFLSLAESRYGHVFSLNYDGVSFPLSTGAIIGYVYANMFGESAIQSYGLFDAWSVSSPYGDYFVVDHTTNEQTQLLPNWQRNLGSVEWIPVGANSTRSVSIWLADTESANTFALHTMSGYVQTLYPTWESGYDEYWNWRTGPRVTFVLGANQSFWLKRECDGVESSSYGYIGYLSYSDLTLDWQYAFPSVYVYEPNWQTVSFQVGQDLLHESFYVYSENGYGGSVWPDSSGGWWEPSVGAYVHGYNLTWDDNGQEIIFYYANYLASVDINQSYLIQDSQGRTSFMDGFVPWHPSPPAGQLSISLGSSRWGHNLKLKQNDGTIWKVRQHPDWWGSALWSNSSGYIFHGTNDQEWVERNTEYLPFIAPYDPNQGFTIIDETRGDEISFPASTSSVDLIEWRPPVQPLILKISATRWNHNLELHTDRGEAFPVARGAMQGFWSQYANGRSWWTSYWTFEANSSVRPLTNWWIYDATTDERSPLNGNDLSNWVSGNATLDADADSLPDWYEVIIGTSSSVQDLDQDGRVDGRDTDKDWLPDGWEVQHLLDPRSPNSVGDLDADDDGLPDWWEFKNNSNPLNWADAGGDLDGDGLTNLQEFEAGTDPHDMDSDDGGFGDVYEVQDGTDPLEYGRVRTFNILLPTGRAGHTFGISAPEDSAFQTLGTGLDEGAVLFEPVVLQASWDADYPFQLLDLTSGDTLTFPSAKGTSPFDTRTMTWSNASGIASQYFLVGPDRAGHSMLLAHPGGVFSLATPAQQINSANAASGEVPPLFEVSALYASNMGFWMIDLATKERSPTNETNLTLSLWSPSTQSVPAKQVMIYLSPSHEGQTFTLHSRARGGAVQMQSVVASIVETSVGSWDPGYVDVDGTIYTLDENGNELVIPPGSCAVRGVVGFGMEFWLTRDADGASGPIMVMGNTASGQWAHGAFPELPPARPLSWVQFRVPHGTAGSHYIEHGDGYISQLQVNSTGWLYSYDDFGNVDQAVQYDTGMVQVDTAQVWWMASGGSRVGNGLDYVADALNWQPTHSEPPPVHVNSIPVTIPLVGWNNVRLVQSGGSYEFFYDSSWGEVSIWNGYTSVMAPYGGAYHWTYEAVGADGEVLYSIPCVTAYVPYDSNQPFYITGEFGSSGAMFAAPANRADLHEWFPPTSPRSLGISSSRWGHQLYLCHPNGSAFPIEQHSTLGGYSIDQSQQTWWNSYYYFDATTQGYDFLDWWIEDRSVFTAAGVPERSPRNPSHGDLINWIALPTPANFSGSIISDGSVQLQWPLGDASIDGAFVIERRFHTNGSWEPVGEVAANTAGEDAFMQFVDQAVRLGYVYYYRVRYRYGGRNSAPSNAVQITGWGDSNGNGAPDWWDAETDPDADPDGDGLTNSEETAAGTSPYKKDNPLLNITVSGFVAP